MYVVDNNIGKGQDFNSVPECVRKEYASRDDYFDALSDMIKNDKHTIELFVDFLMSIDLSEYRPTIFHSSTKDHLREMSKTPFEHFCDVLDGVDEVDDFKSLNEMWNVHDGKKGNFYYINCMHMFQKYEHFCMTCNHTNKEKYNTFITNITQRYNLDKKQIEFAKNDRQYCFKKDF